MSMEIDYWKSIRVVDVTEKVYVPKPPDLKGRNALFGPFLTGVFIFLVYYHFLACSPDLTVFYSGLLGKILSAG